MSTKAAFPSSSPQQYEEGLSWLAVRRLLRNVEMFTVVPAGPASHSCLGVERVGGLLGGAGARDCFG